METYGRFGPLLGVVSIGNLYCKFLVYAAKNAEILTCHEIKLKQYSSQAGYLEFDPNEIWHSISDCIETSIRNLIILDISPLDVIAIGISSQRGTTVLWNRSTGLPLYNAISWCDIRTSSILTTILNGLKGNKNYLRNACGLPLTTCFSALKIKWMFDNVNGVSQSVQENNCMFGTLDSWIIWKLTGGLDGGIHITDVTNASYTMLMNLETANWDRKLCNFFKIPMDILPEIHSCSEVYGYVHDGPLRGIPIASCMGDQAAALLGQLCIKSGQCVCTIDESCFLLLNTGQQRIDSENGLLSTIGFKLGPKERIFYALEGAIANAGSSVNWLKEKLQINTEINQNDSAAEVLSTFLGTETSMISSASSSGFTMDTINSNKKSDLLFVPAFNGLFSPYWKHDSRGLILGLTSSTTPEHITQAAYESTGFQILDILEATRKDAPTWEPIRKLVVGGDFSENNLFMQFVTDIIGIVLERPQTTSPSCIGAMLAAGLAMDVLSLENAHIIYAPPCDTFYPTTTQNRREILYHRWNFAIKKCINWNNFENFEEELKLFHLREKDTNYKVRRSIPGTLFLTIAFGLLTLSKYLQSHNITT